MVRSMMHRGKRYRVLEDLPGGTGDERLSKFMTLMTHYPPLLHASEDVLTAFELDSLDTLRTLLQQCGKAAAAGRGEQIQPLLRAHAISEAAFRDSEVLRDLRSRRHELRSGHGWRALALLVPQGWDLYAVHFGMRVFSGSDPNLEALLRESDGSQLPGVRGLPGPSGERMYPVSLLSRALVDSVPYIRACDQCGRLAGQQHKLKNCSTCGSAAYCGRDCQKAHWPKHKLCCTIDANIIAANQEKLPDARAAAAEISAAVGDTFAQLCTV